MESGSSPVLKYCARRQTPNSYASPEKFLAWGLCVFFAVCGLSATLTGIPFKMNHTLTGRGLFFSRLEGWRGQARAGVTFEQA